MVDDPDYTSALKAAALRVTRNALTAAGLVRRIQPAGSLARYESRVGLLTLTRFPITSVITAPSARR